MEKRLRNKTLALKTRETLRVAWAENLVVSVPIAILVELPVVDVPLAVVGVPVDIHGEDFVP